jgi:hypothetical protein
MTVKLLAVDNVLAVQVLEREDDLCGVEASPSLKQSLLQLTQAFPLGEQSEKFPTLAVLKHEEDLFLILEGGVDLDEEGVIDLGKDVPLHHHALHLVLLLDVLLLHGLDGEELSRVLPPDEDHLGVGTLTNY